LKIDNVELHQFIKGKGITHFYHANSVPTAITYLNARGLLSRGYVTNKGLFQTAQKSDREDKEFDVWFDVFIDTADLHGLFPRQNLYGPVVFKFNIDFLLDSDLDIWITKNNPMYWSYNMNSKDKYFCDVSELAQLWDEIERQKIMFTIRKPNEAILFESLEEIIVDDPEMDIQDNITLHSESNRALLKATEDAPKLVKKINIRRCGYCFCKENYSRMSEKDLAKLFLPKEHEYFS